MTIRADVRPAFSWPLDETPGADLPGWIGPGSPVRGAEGPARADGTPAVDPAPLPLLTPVLGAPPRWPVAGWLIAWAVKLAAAGLLAWCLWVVVWVAVTS